MTSTMSINLGKHKRKLLFVSPLRPVFHTTLVYLRPETMLLETEKMNFKRYLLPSLSVKRHFLGAIVNGIGRTRSGLPGLSIVRLTIFTSGSLLSDFQISTNGVGLTFHGLHKEIK